MNKNKIDNKNQNKSNYHVFVKEKNEYLQNIIRKTILSIKENQSKTIFSNNDCILSINILTDLYEKTKKITNKLQSKNFLKEIEDILEYLQSIIDKLSFIICGFGTEHIEDLLFISFGSEYKDINFDNPIFQAKYELIKDYIQPTGYKIIYWKKDETYSNKPDIFCNNKINDDIVKVESENTLECFHPNDNSNCFHQNIFGIKVIFQNEKHKKTLIVNGILKDIHVDCFTNKYIDSRKHDISLIAKNHKGIEKKIIQNIHETINLKDILIYGNNDIQKKIISVMVDTSNVKQTTLDITIKKFIDLDPYSQRSMIINLLLYEDDNEIKYICYLLYDLISNDENNKNIIYNSLPWKLQKTFKNAIQSTLKYKQEMTDKYDVNKISLEQQIFFLKVNEVIKEKAINKLKEIKGKPDELCYKTKQYLEGLIKIPFGNYSYEPILKNMKETNESFIKLSNILQNLFSTLDISKKRKYTSIEIIKFIETSESIIRNNIILKIRELLNIQTNKTILEIGREINKIKHQEDEKLKFKNISKIENINNIINIISSRENYYFPYVILFYDKLKKNKIHSLDIVFKEMKLIQYNINKMETQIDQMYNKLDSSIYSHKHAKNQIMKIFGQWINGEQNGYCFGFEGSPGIGKTSLAKKGLTNCLINEKGESRPFAFIALGGSANGSTLEGHSFTYVNSTWGRIVDILMETKCMNPIIYIDELDKVSKTEHGKEIIGILTHLIDPTQNENFQDKYFAGIDIDLSKALFIFSYNDPDQIDKILLDRIHRIKFENLSTEEKIVIVNKFILPELNTKMGFENIVSMNNDIIRFIIESYTNEPGVRKLKELLFDLYGEINLEILKASNSDIQEIPITITKQNLEDKYLEKYKKIIEKSIPSTCEVGIINGLWANSLGMGGITAIQTLFFPSSTFLDFKLTGLQGDVMKESMCVAKTLAWNLTSDKIKKEWLSYFETTKCQGLHIHCPEGGISKDGPSAGAAITTAIYSLFNKIKIKNYIAITGEINLNGDILPIGGLETKINGGIKAGVTCFLYPKSNHKDYVDWKKNNEKPENITFIEISNIKDIFEHVFI